MLYMSSFCSVIGVVNNRLTHRLVLFKTVMIQAGNAIDCTIGVVFGLSTLSAAAIGQICSDASGVVFGGTVERLAKAGSTNQTADRGKNRMGWKFDRYRFGMHNRISEFVLY
jgi:Transmembrane protein 65